MFGEVCSGLSVLRRGFRPVVLDVGVVGITLLAVALGGSTRLWQQAIVLFGCGLIMVLTPARLQRAEAGIGAALIPFGMVILGSGAFLPAAWFHGPLFPNWPGDYEAAFGRMVTPQPWLTLECLLLLGAGLLWWGWLARRVWFLPRVTLLSIYLGGLLLLIAGAMVLRAFEVPFFLWQPHLGSIGFFPNRNQTANLVGIGAIGFLSLSIQRLKQCRAIGLWWGLGYVISLAAVIGIGSRAGPLLLLFGTMTWLVWIAKPLRQARRVAIVGSVFLLLLTSFLLAGGSTMARFVDPFGRLQPLVESRWRLHVDAVRLIKDVPWIGVGLGNFSPVFAQKRITSADANRALHPESDWLWLGTEMGILAPLLVLLGVVEWARRHWPGRSDPDFAIRAGLIVAAGAFVAHGFMDVSAHRMGTVWPMILLLALSRTSLSLQHGAAEKTLNRTPRSRDKSNSGVLIPHLVRHLIHELANRTKYRIKCGTKVSANSPPEYSNGCYFDLRYAQECPSARIRGRARPLNPWSYAGSALLVLSTLWLMSALGVATFPNSARLEWLRGQIDRAANVGRSQHVVRLTNEGLHFVPLDWELYFRRALAQANLATDLESVLLDFSRARLLEPNMVQVPFAEGKFWLGREPKLALAAWNEVLRRARSNRQELYTEMLKLGTGAPELRDELRALGLRDGDLWLAFLAQATRDEVAMEVERLVLEDPDLRRLTVEQRHRFFRMWATAGDPHDLVVKFEQHPSWREYGWRAWAQALAAQERFEEACRVVRGRLQPWPISARPGHGLHGPELRQHLLLAPDDFLAGVDLYEAERKRGPVAALMVLRQLTTHPECPTSLWQLRASVEVEEQHWREAWDCFRKVELENGPGLTMDK